MSTRTDSSMAHFNQGYFMAHYLSSGTQELGLAGPILTLHCNEEQTEVPSSDWICGVIFQSGMMSDTGFLWCKVTL